MRTHDQRLYYAFRPDGPCEVIEVIGIKVPTRLAGIWMNGLNRYKHFIAPLRIDGACVSNGLFNICHQGG
jgi:hypothetical protein